MNETEDIHRKLSPYSPHFFAAACGVAMTKGSSGIRARAIDWYNGVPMMTGHPWIFMGQNAVTLTPALEALDDAVYGMMAAMVRARRALDAGDVEDMGGERQGPAA